MEASALLAEYRRRADDNAEPPHVADEQVFVMLSEGEREACLRGAPIFDTSTAEVVSYAVAADQATKEKALLCCGNVAGVSNVNDNMSVDQSEPEATYHDVVRGDTLWAIAKAAYGDGNKYPLIFEANRPMLSHPDKIYPGQKLRIPPL